MTKVEADRPKRQKTGGRAKGTPNRQTTALKDMILGALDKAGGQAYLQRQADESPASFLTLLGKVLPTTITGADGGAIKHSIKVVFGRN